MKPYMKCALAVTAILAATATLAGAQNPYAKWQFDEINFNPPVPERFELSNGLVVFFLPDNQLPVVTMSAVIRARASLSTVPTKTGWLEYLSSSRARV